MNRLCPKCGVRPSRAVNPYRGKIPFCVECYATARRAHDAKWVAIRSAARASQPRVSSAERRAAEIERRFAAAKAAVWRER